VTTQRVPWLTLAVFAVTAAFTAAMLAWPQVGTALERDPAMLRGEWWRFATTWLVLTDGWLQIVVNNVALLLFGTIVERRLGRAWWIIGYIVAGFAGELAGLVWQPVGGGNSVAICGLVGLFAISQLDRRQLPLPARFGAATVCAFAAVWLAFRSDIHGIALATGLIVAAGCYAAGHRGRAA
jgi:rhomboid protease GluP